MGRSLRRPDGSNGITDGEGSSAGSTDVSTTITRSETNAGGGIAATSDGTRSSEVVVDNHSGGVAVIRGGGASAAAQPSLELSVHISSALNALVGRVVDEGGLDGVDHTVGSGGTNGETAHITSNEGHRGRLTTVHWSTGVTSVGPAHGGASISGLSVTISGDPLGVGLNGTRTIAVRVDGGSSSVQNGRSGITQEVDSSTSSDKTARISHTKHDGSGLVAELALTESTTSVVVGDDQVGIVGDTVIGHGSTTRGRQVALESVVVGGGISALDSAVSGGSQEHRA